MARPLPYRRTRWADDVWPLRGIGADHLEQRGRSPVVSLVGSIATPDGFVHALTMPVAVNPDTVRGTSNFGPTSCFYFIHRGKVYQRRYNKIFKRAGLVRLAAKFAREVVGR